MLALENHPFLFAGFVKEFIDQWRRQAFDCVDLAATMVGGLLIALFAI